MSPSTYGHIPSREKKNHGKRDGVSMFSALCSATGVPHPYPPVARLETPPGDIEVRSLSLSKQKRIRKKTRSVAQISSGNPKKLMDARTSPTRPNKVMTLPNAHVQYIELSTVRGRHHDHLRRKRSLRNSYRDTGWPSLVKSGASEDDARCGHVPPHESPQKRLRERPCELHASTDRTGPGRGGNDAIKGEMRVFKTLIESLQDSLIPLTLRSGLQSSL